MTEGDFFAGVHLFVVLFHKSSCVRTKRSFWALSLQCTEIEERASAAKQLSESRLKTISFKSPLMLTLVFIYMDKGMDKS